MPREEPMHRSDLQYLLPRQPKLDKLAALYLLVQYVAKTSLDQVTVLFYDGQAPNGVFVDVDALHDYKVEGFGSAAERVVKQHPELLDVPGMQYFVDLFNFNNKFGRLKNRFEDNFFNLINDWPRVPHSCSKSEHMLRIMRDLFPVFTFYFECAAKAPDRIEYNRNPFCLDGLMRMLDRICPKPEQLESALRTVARLEDNFDLTDRADERTRDAARRIKPELEFFINAVDGVKKTAAVYRSDDTRLVRQMWTVRPDLGVLVMRRRTGNTAIFVRGSQDLTALYAALEQVEPGLWHHERRYKSPFIANGSESRDVETTKLTPTALSELVMQHVTYVPRSQAAAAN